MDITWHGHSCFTIKGKDATIVTDPFEGLGVKLPKLKADIVSVSGEGEIAEVDGDPKVLDWPGEFEVSNVAIEALCPLGENFSIFIFALDGIKICHLSYLSHELTEELIDQIGEVDVLMIPVGGSEVLDGKLAQKVVEAIEPRVVIPMLYAATDTKLNIGGAAEFLKAMGKTQTEPVEKFSLGARSSLPEDRMEFVLLAPKL
ncbi:MAG: MBL fold metallo-hydrolase [Patescibacteria group bacterium]